MRDYLQVSIRHMNKQWKNEKSFKNGFAVIVNPEHVSVTPHTTDDGSGLEAGQFSGQS